MDTELEFNHCLPFLRAEIRAVPLTIAGCHLFLDKPIPLPGTEITMVHVGCSGLLRLKGLHTIAIRTLISYDDDRCHRFLVFVMALLFPPLSHLACHFVYIHSMQRHCFFQ